MATRMTAVPSIQAQWSGVDVDVTTINRQLSFLYADVVQQSSLSSPVRTSILNLVVYATSVHDARKVATALEQVGGRHPSRVIILVPERASPRTCIDAEVTVLCSRRTPDSPPFCWERLLVTALGRSADHLGSVVAPLLMPQLPTYLLWSGHPPFGHRIFHRLLELADQLVIDSAEFRQPGDGFADLMRVFASRQGVNDFHWSRLKPWREIVAQFFDGPSWAPYARAIRSIRLEFGAGGDNRAATAGMLLILGWVGWELGWQPETTLDDVPQNNVSLAVLQGETLIPIDLRFEDRGASAAGRLIRVEIVAQPKTDPPARFVVERNPDVDNAFAIIEVHGGTPITRVVPLKLKTDLELLSDELEASGHDKLYEMVVEMASRLAGREAWIPA